MKLSARNVLKGKVKKLIPGMVNAEVVIELQGGTEIVAVITRLSADGLALAEGTEVHAIVKASNVMIATE